MAMLKDQSSAESQLPTSARLVYRHLTPDAIDTFHQLVVDEHISRYLLDGETMDRDWCENQLRASDLLFQSDGLGVWLVYERSHVHHAIGFCGFVRFMETGAEPQLVYALRAARTGRGYATEMAASLIDFAARNTSLSVVHSGVDEPNRASMRVLEKVGFERCGSVPGAFGQIVQYRRPLTS